MRNFLDKVLDLSLFMPQSVFIEVYGEHLGNHLFDKYIGARKDFMRWYGGLDNNNRDKIIAYIINRK